MRTRMIVISTISAALLILFTGCRRDLKDFSLSYSMESINNFKVVVSMNSDKTYKIEQYNYYVDNMARQRKPLIVEGTMDEQEYKEARKFIQKANLMKMKDSYGFDVQASDTGLGDLMYQIHFNTNNKDKYISIRETNADDLPKSYLRLVDYLNTFINTNKSKE